MIIVDFETRSRCDLIKQGTYNYAAHPSTDALCCTFIPYEGDWEYLWRRGQKLPEHVVQALNEAHYICAVNAGFDRSIWAHVAVRLYGFPVVAFERWYCAAAQFRVNNIPAALGAACDALELKTRKDTRGAYLINQLSIPRADGTFNEDPKLMEEMCTYCVQDGRATKAALHRTRLMTELEHLDWLIAEDMNEVGVLVDVDLAKAAQRQAENESDEYATLISIETDGVVTKTTQSVRAAKWIVETLPANHPALDMMIKIKAGEVKYSVDKGIREDILDAIDAGIFDVDTAIYNVLVLLDESSMSSVSKFKNMALRADSLTNRVQGAFVYAGASQTLRFASRGLQLHNFPSRGLDHTPEENAQARKMLIDGAEFDEPIMPVLKNLLRYAIKAANGYSLVVGDWSGIEARILPWLSMHKDGLAKVAKIASGTDVYLETANGIGFEGRRDLGKVCELALGYAGGLHAFKQFAKPLHVILPDDSIRAIIQDWRELNKWVVWFWDRLESAALDAVRNAGVEVNVGRVSFIYAESLMEGSLLVRLPDDSVLTYPDTRIEAGRYREKLTAMKSSVKMKKGERHWPREDLYGGKIAGHVTQGTAGALLRDTLRRVENVVAHVHDEIILEVPTDEAEIHRKELAFCMCQTPAWADGLPLSARPFITDRYRK